MGIIDQSEHEWEQLFTQYKNPAGDTVVCMVHKATKKRVYFDGQLNRLLSKQEAKLYTLDLTGKYEIITQSQS